MFFSTMVPVTLGMLFPKMLKFKMATTKQDGEQAGIWPTTGLQKPLTQLQTIWKSGNCFNDSSWLAFHTFVADKKYTPYLVLILNITHFIRIFVIQHSNLTFRFFQSTSLEILLSCNTKKTTFKKVAMHTKASRGGYDTGHLLLSGEDDVNH